jgi:hypothetical protein
MDPSQKNPYSVYDMFDTFRTTMLDQGKDNESCVDFIIDNWLDGVQVRRRQQLAVLWVKWYKDARQSESFDHEKIVSSILLRGFGGVVVC